MQAVWELVLRRLLERDVDPIRLFIKPEPHKESKLVEGRYRLISSVSVIDQIIDTMLFGPMNEMMVKNVVYLPSKFGWSPYVGGWRLMPRGGQLALDKSSWDWTVCGWCCEMVLEIRKRLCKNLTQEWLELAEWRYKELFGQPWFITSGGQLLRQREPGVMKSGCVNTISDNSIMQVILHVRVCSEIGVEPGPILSMGDDTLQEPVENQEEYERVLARYCKVKETHRRVEFAGHIFSGMRVEPAYWSKHCFQMLHADPAIVPDLGISYSLLYHRSNKKRLVQSILAEMGAELPPDEMLDVVFDGW
uniref:RNA-directed RNA polymerase C-terminal domain-containing protein n=1 Tax=Riboviria sp. TaxID=2585031 RepID=A0A8K1U1Y7_9VIRU|nr:MAG: hypothetical protein 2 [Riboviria sp.]